jgi:hypothetical protein
VLDTYCAGCHSSAVTPVVWLDTLPLDAIREHP